MVKFQLQSTFKPTGDQPEAIEKLYNSLTRDNRHQVLLGVTGSGKTFTMANIIALLQKPTLIISHNKTLAAQLYQEFRDFFPQNAVSYFVSYYDYYQPEAYVPQTDTYIEKETEINEEIDKLRLAATTNLLTRKDTIVVASVSCIYNIGSPREYGHFVLELKKGIQISRQSLFKRLVDLMYSRSDYGFHRGSFRVRGENIDLFPAYEDTAIRISTDGDKILSLEKLDPLNGTKIKDLDKTVIYPAKHYMTDPTKQIAVFAVIKKDLEERVGWFKKQGKLLEAQRLFQKVNYDLEMIQEIGFVNGIENYSRYFDGRLPGDPPYTLLDYFEEAAKKDWLLVIDESHMTIPQIRGMYNGDRARKQTLIDFGFRLPAALDNRPLKFVEFMQRVHRTIYVSATPDRWEVSIAEGNIAEQLIRPTGLTDPEITIRPTAGQIDDLITRIEERVERKERVLVTTLTKKMAEALSSFLKEKNMKVHYLHADVITLERSDILDDLRLGKYDVIVGINLLREGLDLPEVSLVAILDADQQGFLRSKTALIQTMGRAARHINGTVVMYADNITDAMKDAIKEVARRRKIQKDYNQKHSITPESIIKPVRQKLVAEQEENEYLNYFDNRKKQSYTKLLNIDIDQLIPEDKTKLTKKLTREMKTAAVDLNFELAATLRDKIREIKSL
ncbi:excinuclease ABC subunit UvrB [Candidatus Gottesmanbacteria bacterium]|nr:excinuclease ABC subunit UvrB [Candidatus Gottesmanbacteria bacterium]